MDAFKNNMRNLGSIGGKVNHLHQDLTELNDSINTTEDERSTLLLFEKLQKRVPKTNLKRLTKVESI